MNKKYKNIESDIYSRDENIRAIKKMGGKVKGIRRLSCERRGRNRYVSNKTNFWWQFVKQEFW